MIWRLLQKQSQFLHFLTRHRQMYTKIRSPAWERIFFEKSLVIIISWPVVLVLDFEEYLNLF